MAILKGDVDPEFDGLKDVLLARGYEGATGQRAREQVANALFPWIESHVLNNELEHFVRELGRHLNWMAAVMIV